MKESVGLMECIDKVDAEMRKHNPLPCKPVVDPANPNLIRAWGFASAYKNTGLGGGAPDISGADVELYEDGTFQVRSSAAELGQGLVTVMRLIVAEEMAVAPEKVSVLVMDTDFIIGHAPEWHQQPAGHVIHPFYFDIGNSIENTSDGRWRRLGRESIF